MADRLKLAQGLRNLPASAREDLAGREQDIQRGKTVELLRRAGKEMYENPIVNTAIGFTPGVGDVQAAGETFAALQRGAPWQETAGYAVGMLPFVPALRTTWHGSPHGFTKFDMSKIGTGEGAQAYGHGLYLAEARPVAEEYATNLSKDFFNVGGELFNPADIKHLNVRTLARKGDIDSAIKKATELAASDSPVADLAKLDLDLLQQAKAKGGFQEATGYLYKVDLPDEQIAKMLDWDKPFSQQNETVREALKRRITDVTPTDNFDMGGNARLRDNRAGQIDPNSSNPWLLETVSQNGTSRFGLSQGDVDRMFGTKDVADLTGEQIISRLAQERGGQAQASAYLNELGIPGIQYLDQASRGAGEGTRNYVVFSDEIPQILERNGQPVAQALRNYETPQAQALREAEEYGQKMLGLPPGNTPMDRAIAGGYVEPSYHGTKTDVPEFDLSYHGTATDPGDFGEALYSSASPNIAGHYAESTMRGATTEGANIMPLLTRKGNQMQVEGMKGMEPLLEKAGGIENWFDMNPQQQAQIAKDMGYTSVRDFGYPQTANYDLGDVRSKFAAFDPRYFGKPGLMLGAGGLGVYGALQGEDEYQ